MTMALGKPKPPALINTGYSCWSEACTSLLILLWGTAKCSFSTYLPLLHETKAKTQQPKETKKNPQAPQQ